MADGGFDWGAALTNAAPGAPINVPFPASISGGQITEIGGHPIIYSDSKAQTPTPPAPAPQQQLDYGSLIDAAAQKYGVDPQLARAIALHGENYGKGWTSPTAVSPKGAIGVMQIMPANANGVDLRDPAANIDRGVQIIGDLSTRYGGDPAKIAAAYNAGPGAVDKYGGTPPFAETQGYVQRVTDAMGPPQAPTSDLDAAFGINRGAQPPTADLDKAFGVGAPGAPMSASQQAARAAAQANLNPQGVPIGLGVAANSALAGTGPLISGGLAAAGTGIQNALAGVGIGQAAPYSPSEAFTANRDVMQGAFDQYSHEHPVANALASIAGFATPGGAADVIGSGIVRGLGRATPVLETTLGRIAARTAGNVGAAGAVGAGEAASHGEGIGGIARQAGTSAAIAAPLGLAGEMAGAVGAGALHEAAPFLASVSPRAVAVQAGRKLAQGTTDLAGTRNALAGWVPGVEGSELTPYQISGDTGLGRLEAGSRAVNAAPFVVREGEQNIARRNALEGLKPGVDVGELPRNLQANEKAARAGEGRLWDQLRDSLKDTTANVQATKTEAKAIMAEMAPTSPMLSGREAKILKSAQEMSDIAPAAHLIELRKAVNDGLRREMRKAGATPTYARLSRLLSAIDRNLNETVSDRVAADEVNVAHGGQAATQESARDFLKRYLASTPASQQRILAGDRARGTAGGGAGGGPSAAGGDGGAGGASGGATGPAAGSAGVSGQPTFGEEARGQLAAANAATRARAETFGNAPVQSVAKLEEPSAIKRQVGTILGGRDAVAGMRALAKAAGDKTALKQAVAEHMTDGLVGNTEVGTSGVEGISANKFHTYLKKNQAALREVFSPPEMKRLQDIADDITKAKRSDNPLGAKGSPTAEKTIAAGQFLKHTTRGGLDLLGGILASHGGQGAGMEALFAGFGVAATDAIQQLRALGINRVNDLVTQGVLNRQAYLALTQKFANTPSAKRQAVANLIKALGRGARTATATGAANNIEDYTRRNALAGVR